MDADGTFTSGLACCPTKDEYDDGKPFKPAGFTVGTCTVDYNARGFRFC